MRYLPNQPPCLCASVVRLSASVVLVAVFVLFASGVPSPVRAQTPPMPPMPMKPSDGVRVMPVRVDVVVARYQGDKRVSSLPYTMSINAATRGVGQVRMGADIPLSTALAPAPGSDPGKAGVAPSAVSYDQIGTSIDCAVRPTDDGRYLVDLTVSDKTVYAENEGPAVARPGRNPAFRSFRSSNAVVLKDGQTTQFTAAADRVTGEVVRIEVTLQVVK